MKSFASIVLFLIAISSFAFAQNYDDGYSNLRSKDRFGFFFAPKYSFHETEYFQITDLNAHPDEADKYRFTELNGFGFDLGFQFDNYSRDNVYLILSAAYSYTNGDKSEILPFSTTIELTDTEGNKIGEKNITGDYELVIDNYFHIFKAGIGVKNNFFEEFFVSASLNLSYVFESKFINENKVKSISDIEYKDLLTLKQDISGAYNKSFYSEICVSLEYQLLKKDYNIAPFLKFSKGLWSLDFDDYYKKNNGIYDYPEDIVLNSIMAGVTLYLK